jgi:small subunit ribosomal protein S20
MAQHASAEKRNRQRLKRTARNRSLKSSLRTELKKARAAVEAKPADAAALVKEAVSALDRAASKGVIPAKRASRLKGRLALAMGRASAAK